MLENEHGHQGQTPSLILKPLTPNVRYSHSACALLKLYEEYLILGERGGGVSFDI